MVGRKVGLDPQCGFFRVSPWHDHKNRRGHQDRASKKLDELHGRNSPRTKPMNCHGEHRRCALECQTLKEQSEERVTTGQRSKSPSRSQFVRAKFSTPPLCFPPDALMTSKYGENALMVAGSKNTTRKKSIMNCEQPETPSGRLMEHMRPTRQMAECLVHLHGDHSGFTACAARNDAAEQFPGG